MRKFWLILLLLVVPARAITWEQERQRMIAEHRMDCLYVTLFSAGGFYDAAAYFAMLAAHCEWAYEVSFGEPLPDLFMMNHALVVVDNFHPEPDALRAAVVASEFKTETYVDGAVYTGISHHQDPQIRSLIAQALSTPIIPRLSVFRVSYANELPHNFVHSDGICAEWAGLLYLNTPEQCRQHHSGTAFFRHRALGIDAMPNRADLPPEMADRIVAGIEADWLKPGPWEVVGFVGMKFNRFVAYPTARFHSRYPHEAFGFTPKDGRLILACFFDVDRALPTVTG